MAIPILNHLNVKGNINLNDYRLNDFVVDHSTEGDAGNTTGKLIYDSGTLKYYDGSSWQSLGTSSGTMSSWVLEDGDGTEVSIADSKEIKFIDGAGLQINWTDTSDGSDADPYDLTFEIALSTSDFTKVAPANGDVLLTLDNDGSTTQFTGVAELATLFAGSGLTATNGIIAVDTLNQDTTGTAAIATTVTVADESSDTTCFPLFATAATGNLAPKSGTNLTFNSSTGVLTATAFAGNITGDVTGTSSLVTVTDSNTDTAFPVVFNDESDALLDDTGAFTYNPNSGTLSVANLTVTGTQTVNNVEVIETSSGVVFEGSTADAFETTLDVVDPTADRAINLPNASGTVVLEDNTATLTNKTIAISQVTELSNLTATEGAQLENINSVTISNAQWGYLGSASSFGGSLIDDADAAAARTTLGVDAAGTDNSTDVTLAGSLDYITISGQTITRNAIVLTTDVSGTLPIANGGTGAGSASAAFTALKQAATTSATGVVELATSTEAKDGSGSGKVVDASQIGARSVVATIDVSDSTFASNLYAEINHGLGTEDVVVQLFDSSTKETVFADVARTDKAGSASTAKIKITFAAAPSNDIEVIVTSAAGASAGTVAYS